MGWNKRCERTELIEWSGTTPWATRAMKSEQSLGRAFEIPPLSPPRTSAQEDVVLGCELSGRDKLAMSVPAETLARRSCTC